MNYTYLSETDHGQGRVRDNSSDNEITQKL